METERLILRRAQASDLTHAMAMINSAFVQRYNLLNPVTAERMASILEADGKSEDVFYLEHKEIGKVMGRIQLEPDELRYGVEALSVSYYLDETYTAQGYMSEALRQVMPYVFDERQVELLSARVFKENTASIRLLERLGFQREGCIRRCVKNRHGVIFDDLLYSMLREEYDRER